MSLPVATGLNELALSAFAAILAVTLGVTYWAAKRTRTATDFWAAGRRIGSAQNGFAISGDLMSAASFLGFTGLIFLGGFDGWLITTASILAFLLVLLLFAERMRNAGKFTFADVLAARLREGPARAAAASATLFIAVIYLIAQLVGAGILLQTLTGLSFAVSVVGTGAFMIVYVVFGGMLGITWVQIIKAGLLLTAGAALSLLVLGKTGMNPIELFNRAADAHPAGKGYLGPGASGRTALDTISVALAFMVGTAALPHVLMRFFTVPDAAAARRSTAWAVGLIGSFFIMTSIIGFGARALLGPGAEKAAGPGGNLAAPKLAEKLGGGVGTVGGDLFLAFVSAVAFATILAVVAGLVIAASGAVAHDVWSGILRRGQNTERGEPRVARITAVAIGLTAIGLTMLAGPAFNVAFLVGLALSVAASANFPALLLSLTWRRFSTPGAITGIGLGLVSALVLIVLSPSVWPGPDSQGSPFPLAFPTLISIPVGFVGCWLGTVLSTDKTGERTHTRMRVRTHSGLGAEPAAAGAERAAAAEVG
jgi:cation/acetate symporter